MRAIARADSAAGGVKRSRGSPSISSFPTATRFSSKCCTSPRVRAAGSRRSRLRSSSGGSVDATAQIADELARTYPHVRVVHHPKNRGYGGALQTGFQAASKPLIFYTDGDAQYDPAELALLWRKMTPETDLVNGYKISRSDPLHRIIVGRMYHHIVSFMFGLTVRDVDGDFRLMRLAIFERINLEKTSGVICLEMMKKIQDAGFRIVEVPVHHYHRAF